MFIMLQFVESQETSYTGRSSTLKGSLVVNAIMALIYAIYELGVVFKSSETQHSVHSFIFFIWPVSLVIFGTYKVIRFFLDKFTEEYFAAILQSLGKNKNSDLD